MKTLRRFTIALSITLVVTLVFCEAGLRLVRANAPSGDTVDRLLISARSDPHNRWYKHSAYWSPEFVQNAAKMDARYIENKDGVFQYIDTAIAGYTERNGERLTTDQPATFTRQVWLYGNSASWGAFVGDSGTVSSALQREFNAHGLLWRSRNMAQASITIPIEYYWLTKSDIKPGDIVIFLDGVEYGFVQQEAQVAWQDSLSACQLEKHVSLLVISTWCSTDMQGIVPQGIFKPIFDKESADYRRMVNKAKLYAQSQGAAFYHFLQPKTNLDSDWYKRLADGDPILMISPDEFFDTVHFDDDGSAEIAAQIYAAIWQRF